MTVAGSRSPGLCLHGDAARLEGVSFGFLGMSGVCITICGGRWVLLCSLGVLNLGNHTFSPSPAVPDFYATCASNALTCCFK